MVKKAVDSDMWRYERKFIVPREVHREMFHFLALHPARFTQVYSARFINNIYFDSLDYTFYRENLAGLSQRKKIRIRWYGTLYGVIVAVLEIKFKKGGVGAKQSYKLNPFFFSDQTNIRDIKQLVLNSDIPEKIKQEMYSLDMTLLNRYFRTYFLSLDKKFRITLDEQQAFFRVDNYNNFSESFMTRDSSIILELKYGCKDDVMSDVITNFFPFRVSRNSKYVNGIHYVRI